MSGMNTWLTPIILLAGIVVFGPLGAWAFLRVGRLERWPYGDRLFLALLAAIGVSALGATVILGVAWWVSR